MNSGTPASVALPDRSSFGMMMSTSTRTVAHSCAVKNFGLNGAFAPAAAAGAPPAPPARRLRRLGLGPREAGRERHGAEQSAASIGDRSLLHG